MGWSSGSRLATRLIKAAKENLWDELEREDFYIEMIDAFEDADCDTLDECLGTDQSFDIVYNRKYPNEDAE